MSGLNWKPFVYGGLASIVAEFGKNLKKNDGKYEFYATGGYLWYQLFLEKTREQIKRVSSCLF